MSSLFKTEVQDFRQQFDELKNRPADELSWLKTERRLQLQYIVTRVLAESSSLDEAAPKLLQSICIIERLQFGELWGLDREKNVLRYADCWHASSLDAGEFILMGKRITFQIGQGLPGKVWASRKPSWIVDVGSVRESVRLSHAVKLGFRSALAIPLYSQFEVSGVMIFYSRERRTPDTDLLELFEASGRQIGGFIHRYRAEKQLRENEKRFRSLFEHSSDLIALVDAGGKVLYLAPSVKRILGYA